MVKRYMPGGDTNTRKPGPHERRAPAAFQGAPQGRQGGCRGGKIGSAGAVTGRLSNNDGNERRLYHPTRQWRLVPGTLSVAAALASIEAFFGVCGMTATYFRGSRRRDRSDGRHLQTMAMPRRVSCSISTAGN